MLYLLHGPDFKKSRKKLNEIVRGLQSRKLNSEVFKVIDEDFINEDSGESKLKELIYSQGLFGGSYIVICERLLGVSDSVLNLLPQIAEAGHIFVFLEEKLSKKHTDLFEKYGAKIQFFDAKNEWKRPFNVFLLSDALAKKDKKNVWLFYQKALKSDLSAEQIHGTLFWQVKTLAIVALSDGGKSLGIKPFVLKKSQSALRKWTKKELLELSHRLVSAYHESRLGGSSLETALEEIILSV